MISDERGHGEGIKAQFCGHIQRGCGRFRRSGSTHKHTMVEIKRFVYEWHGGGTTASEDKDINRNPFRFFPIRADNRAVIRVSCETTVGVCSFNRITLFVFHARFPRTVQPIGSAFALNAHIFPPYITVVSNNHIGEDGITSARRHGHWVSVFRGTRSNAEESSFGVNRIQATIWSGLQPGNIVANGFYFPTGNGGLKHREVGFSASRGESGTNVVLFTFRAGEAEDEHVFGHPAFVASHIRSNTQC